MSNQYQCWSCSSEVSIVDLVASKVAKCLPACMYTTHEGFATTAPDPGVIRPHDSNKELVQSGFRIGGEFPAG